MKECKECGKQLDKYANAFHKLCIDCNNKRLRDNKTRNKHVEPVSEQSSIIVPFRKVRRATAQITTKSIQLKKEPVNPYGVKGEAELFKRIWSERPHVCNHCGKHLGDELKAHYCSHIYPKSIRPWLRLDPNNVELLCIECHTEHDFGKRKKKL